ncbi:MAG: enoyl-CoA hydratase/isomerase family protein [Burkholderiales bacterium]
MIQDLLVDVRDCVMRITINREERRNAINPDVVNAISAALDRAQTDGDIRVIVLTGAGTKAFCSGADLQSGKSFQHDHSQPTVPFANLARKVRQLNVPLVARVNGACMAGGIGLLSMCDMAVASEHAIFGLPEVKVGVFPSQVLCVLQHLIPRRVLNEMCITGEPITAADAKSIGLVNHVSEDLDGKLTWLLDRILDKSPSAIRRGLYTMKRIDGMSFEEAAAFAESQIALTAMTEDANEGRAAFREKRKPVWTGR